MSGRLARFAKVLSHPLALLLAGALVTSIVVPAITRSWQDHEKELAVKSQLVEDVTAKTSTFLAAIQFARVRGEDEDAKAVNDGYRQFLVDGAVLASRLSARLPDSSIAARWRSYTHLVEELYALGGLDDPRLVPGKARTILTDFQRTAEPLSPDAEAERRLLINRGGAAGAGKEWAALYGEALGQRDAIARAILDTDDVAI